MPIASGAPFHPCGIGAIAAPFHYSRIEAAAVRRAAATTESHGDGANPPGIAAARY